MADFGSYSPKGGEMARRRLRKVLFTAGYPENPLGALRSQSGMGQLELARKSGISQGAISELENGERQMSEKMSRKLGEGLGVPPRSLLTAFKMGSLKSTVALDEDPGPVRILELLLLVEESVAAGDLKDRLRDALTDALGASIARDREREKELLEKQAQAQRKTSLKSARGAKKGPDRDVHGRRVSKPVEAGDPLRLGLKSAGVGERRIERDGFGRNRSKNYGG